MSSIIDAINKKKDPKQSASESIIVVKEKSSFFPGKLFAFVIIAGVLCALSGFAVYFFFVPASKAPSITDSSSSVAYSNSSFAVKDATVAAVHQKTDTASVVHSTKLDPESSVPVSEKEVDRPDSVIKVEKQPQKDAFDLDLPVNQGRVVGWKVPENEAVKKTVKLKTKSSSTKKKAGTVQKAAVEKKVKPKSSVKINLPPELLVRKKPAPVVKNGTGPNLDYSKWVLQGIAGDEKGYIAIMNDKIVGVGDEVLGAKILEIGTDYVKLKKEKREFRIHH